MKTANGRSEIRKCSARISFVREPTVQRWIAGNTVPSLNSFKEGVTTKLSAMTKRNEVKLFFRSATQPVMVEEIVYSKPDENLNWKPIKIRKSIAVYKHKLWNMHTSRRKNGD